ncbi:MAG: metallophosphoesterase [Chromatiales bacterium]|nr:metallophosphoesterase [Chromatiales bacterium]
MIQVTDLHLQADPAEKMQGAVIEQRWLTVFKHIQRYHSNADLLILTGDLVHHCGPVGYQRLVAQMKELNIPAVWLPGNHDDAQQMHEFGTAELNRKSVELRDWQLVLLDSTANADGVGGGSLAQSELDYLERILANPHRAHQLVVLHHNPVKLGSGWQDKIALGNADAFWQRIDRAEHVRGIAFGHVHQAWAFTHNGVPLFSSPAVAPQYKARCDDVVMEDDPAKTGPAYAIYSLESSGQIKANVVRL